MRKHAFTLRSRAHSRRVRIICIMAAFAAIFSGIFLRLVQLGMEQEASLGISITYDRAPGGRPAIVDRNGELLATDIPIASLFIEPRSIPDLDEAVEKLTGLFPELDARELHSRLHSKDAFTWIKRQITPDKQQAVIDSGLAAIGFRPENRRLYPNGSLAAHILGAVDIDNRGIAGIEKWIDANWLADLRGAGMELKGRELHRSSCRSTCASNTHWSRSSARPSRNSGLPRVPGSCSTSPMAKFSRSPPIRTSIRTIRRMHSSQTE
ncbi:penicillin-binding protein [Sinorhizobium medicae]|nr:hypothetical protein [Sinorhizobium medicae]TWA29518.1 penicillin-binding protein [Sinorhizobium medicae]